MTPAVSMPPTIERGKDLWGSMVSSATLAVFSKPVIAKKDSATPARMARAGLPLVAKSASTPKSALPSATYQTPMNMTISRPTISTKVISHVDDDRLGDADEVDDRQHRDEHERDEQRRRQVTRPRRSTAENPVASDPAAAKLAERKDTVTRNVSALLPNALLT